MIDKLETTILNALQYIYDELGWLGVTIVMIIENATGLTPSEVVLGFAGWMLIDAHGLPFSTVFWGGLAAAIGSVIGASILYWTARVGGRPVVDRMAKFFRIDLRHIERVERMAKRWGTGFIFFGITHSKQQITPTRELTTLLSSDLEPIANALNAGVRRRFERASRQGPLDDAACTAAMRSQSLPQLQGTAPLPLTPPQHFLL